MAELFAEQEDESPWVSVSDLMSGLMLVFLCIAVFFLRKQTEIARDYREIQVDLAAALAAELDQMERERWGAVLMGEELVIRFLDPETKFTGGDATLAPGFQVILAEFFPQLVSVLARAEFRDHVREIRIEGHTSSEWMIGGAPTAPDIAYLLNMELSQRRALSVLSFVVRLPEVAAEAEWLRRGLRANGLSSSQRITDEVGKEDALRSRRVDFRVVTDAEDRMKELMRTVGTEL